MGVLQVATRQRRTIEAFPRSETRGLGRMPALPVTGYHDIPPEPRPGNELLNITACFGLCVILALRYVRGTIRGPIGNQRCQSLKFYEL